MTTSPGPAYTGELQPLTLPPEPTQNAGETLPDFYARHSAWWRGCDVVVKAREVVAHERLHDDLSAMVASFGSAIQPTIDAWASLDARLVALAQAIGQSSTQSGGGDGQVSEQTMLDAMRIVKGDAA